MARTITVYFATNRMPETGPRDKIIDFSSDLGPVDGTNVRFGSAQVEVTADGPKLVPGSLDVEDEKLFGRRQKKGSKTIFEALRANMKETCKPTLAFIHGFGNSFSDAMERAASIVDLYGLDWNIFAFTWPSRGSAIGIPLPYVDYIHDRGTARASGVAIARTINILYNYIDSLPMREVCRQPIHLLCHSMGNYALRHAIQALMRLPLADPLMPIGDPLVPKGIAEMDDPERRNRLPTLVAVPTEAPDPNRLRRTFDQMVLAAPDEDDDALSDPEEMKFLPRLGNAVTVYHTEDDWILSTLSRFTKFNGPRLGMAGPDNMSLISDKITAVDVSATLDLGEDMQNHQYYRAIESVRDDIVAVLQRTPPPNRQLISPYRFRLTA